MARTKGISGLAVAMIGAGALLVRAAIKGTNPIEELRDIIIRNKAEPLSTEPRGSVLSDPAYTPTPAGGTGSGGKVVSGAGLRPHVAAQADYVASTWGVEVQGFAFRNIAGTNILSDHARGLAIDAMTRDMGIGNAIFQYYVSNADRLHVKYVIWQHTIWSQERGSHGYSKNDHLNHVHISFYNLGSPRAQ